MSLSEMFASAIASLAANKLRSFLTMLGILIGVASIIAIIAVGDAGKRAIVSAISSRNLSQVIRVLPKELVVPGLPQAGQILSISPNDFQIVQQFSNVTQVDYTVYGQSSVATAKNSINASVDGGPSYLNDLAQFTVIKGHMFQRPDVIARQQVVVLSQSLAGKLFGNGNPVGATVQIGGLPFQVIGVSVPNQVNVLSFFYGSDYAYMPETTCAQLFPNWGISEMDVGVAPNADKSALSKRIVTALNVNAHNASAFEDSSGFLSGIEGTIAKVTSILTLVIGAIAGIALFVGGVGVMNIMLVSVTERTQEIGIRMSLGATRQMILLQFLIESMVITLIGGVGGILLGIGLSVGVTLLTHIPTFVSWPVVVLSFLFSAVIGILCGLYPANQAARQNPIDALRYE